MIRVIEDPDGDVFNTDYLFDTLGNLRKTTQGVQNRYFMHDSIGRLLYSKQPEEEANTGFTATDPITGNTSWSNKYVYDDAGNITSTTNAANVSVSATYDKFNRIVQRDYSDSTPDVSFFYDGTGLGSVPNYSKGQTTKVASSVSETRYTSFDSLGRLLTHEQRTTAGQLTGTETPYQTGYTYNLSGAILTETYPSGRVISYDYRQDGELDSVSGVKTGQTSSFTYLDNISYNTLGNIEKMRLGNGTWESAEYNSRQQISQIALGYSDTDKSLLKIDYGYGTNAQNNGSLREQKINYYGLTHEITQNYTYDDLNRLKSAEEKANNIQSWKQTFDYDRYGNREFNPAGTTTLLQNNKITNPEILEADNRLKKDQDGDSVIDYDYDKAGNVTLDAENQRFIYDAENHIKEFFRGSNGGSTPDATYQYDGDGRRVRKIADTVETIFVYNAGGTLVAEYSNELPQNAKVSYLTSDHLGSPRIVTDGIRAVVSRHDYLAFGDEVTETVGNVAGRTSGQGYGGTDEIRKQYTGYERDKESGLDFAQARYYNSQQGRFTSVDPLTASASIRNPQTFNRYSYVLNSPYKFTDPLGMLPMSVTKKSIDCTKSCLIEGQRYYSDELLGDQIPTDAGVADQTAGSPALQNQRQQDYEAQLRSQFPSLNQADQGTVNQAISDAQNAVGSIGFSVLLIVKFRNQGDQTSPSQTLVGITASTESSITVTRDSNGQITEATVNENAVYDGRASTLSVDDDNNANTPNVTVAQFFQNNPTVNAITYAGYIFVGDGFFNQDADGRAKSMIHEAVVHKGFGRSDTDFGKTRSAGSRAINAFINNHYRRNDPIPITTTTNLDTTIVPRMP